MERISVNKKILEIIYEVTGRDDIQENQNLLSKENKISAIDMVYIYIKIENEFKVKLSDYVKQGPQSLVLGRIVEYICSQ